MKNTTRNNRIAEAYLTSKFSMKELADRYSLSPTSIRDILKSLIGIEKIEQIKQGRKMEVAEKLKQDYLSNIWGKK